MTQRRSIAWCGKCGNVSVDGINFSRVDGGLQCAACGAVSEHFEYWRRSAIAEAMAPGPQAPGRAEHASKPDPEPPAGRLV